LFGLLAAVFAAGCNSTSVTRREETPTDVLKKYVEAMRKKDVETMKQTLSSNTLKLIDESARRVNMTLDDALRKEGERTLPEMPETRNERIEGDTATVEVKNAVTNDWDVFPFVKEEGKWKIALDKFIEDLRRKLSERTTVPPTNNSSPAAKTTPPAAKQNR
jgi:hypothetical protein